jgi:transporter family-2 protein
MAALVFLLLIVAGAALVAQNLLMAQMTASVSTVLIALVMNSAVGLLALSILLVGRAGLSGVGETIGAFRPWSILPGLLGSFFVFASIVGYQRLGAAATISILVASQLVFGLAIDIARSDPATAQSQLPAFIGAGLLISGAILVASRDL